MSALDGTTVSLNYARRNQLETSVHIVTELCAAVNKFESTIKFKLSEINARLDSLEYTVRYVRSKQVAGVLALP